jgi:hypothetical protein
MFKFYFGNITIDDIISSWDYAIENKIIPLETNGFIVDYRNAHFNFPIKEYHRISQYFKDHLNIFGNKRIAVITENPRDIVIPTLVEKEDEGYSSRPFSTVQAAVHWILDHL